MLCIGPRDKCETNLSCFEPSSYHDHIGLPSYSYEPMSILVYLDLVIRYSLITKLIKKIVYSSIFGYCTC